MLASIEQFLKNSTNVRATELADVIDFNDPSFRFPVLVPVECMRNACPDLGLAVLKEDALLLPCLFPLTTGLLSVSRDGASFGVMVQPTVRAYASIAVQEPGFE